MNPTNKKAIETAERLRAEMETHLNRIAALLDEMQDAGYDAGLIFSLSITNPEEKSNKVENGLVCNFIHGGPRALLESFLYVHEDLKERGTNVVIIGDGGASMN